MRRGVRREREEAAARLQGGANGMKDRRARRGEEGRTAATLQGALRGAKERRAGRLNEAEREALERVWATVS